MTQRERIANPEDIQLARLEEFSARLRTATPGIVKAVDLEAQTCTVQVAIQGYTVDPEGEKAYHDLPLLLDVPIVWPRAGGFSLTFPVKAEDECLVVFGERCIDAWWQSGGVQKPIDMRMHDLSDAFAIFGCTSQPRKLPDVKADAVELRTDTRSDWISLRQGSLDIHIEGPTTVFTKTAEVNVDSSAKVNCQTAELHASQSALVDTPSTTITGDTVIEKSLTVKGGITGQGGMQISGGSGASVTGDLKTTGDVVAGAISLKTHTHTEQGDGAETSGPH